MCCSLARVHPKGTTSSPDSSQSSQRLCRPNGLSASRSRPARHQFVCGPRRLERHEAHQQVSKWAHCAHLILAQMEWWWFVKRRKRRKKKQLHWRALWLTRPASVTCGRTLVGVLFQVARLARQRPAPSGRGEGMERVQLAPTTDSQKGPARQQCHCRPNGQPLLPPDSATSTSTTITRPYGLWRAEWAIVCSWSSASEQQVSDFTHYFAGKNNKQHSARAPLCGRDTERERERE